MINAHGKWTQLPPQHAEVAQQQSPECVRVEIDGGRGTMLDRVREQGWRYYSRSSLPVRWMKTVSSEGSEMEMSRRPYACASVTMVESRPSAPCV